MNEITLSFTPEELRELTKQLIFANLMVVSCDYDNQTMVDEIMLKVCATGFLEAPETGAFSHGGFGDRAFTFSNELDDECYPILELFEIDCIEEYLPYALADRDFEEQYGYHEAMEIVTNKAWLKAKVGMQDKYIKEFETYGVTHLRLEKKKKKK